jgi:hypothetical protein
MTQAAHFFTFRPRNGFTRNPLWIVRLFKSFHFASCNLMFFIVGAVLFSSTVLLPQFLQTLLDYTAEAAGSAAYVGLPTEKNNAAAGVMNFMRKIGQSVGTSVVTTLIARRTQYHQSVLAEYTGSLRFETAVRAPAHRLLMFYRVLAVVSTLMFLLSFLLANNDPKAGGEIPMH